jgi:catecholate siderophore receptor
MKIRVKAQGRRRRNRSVGVARPQNWITLGALVAYTTLSGRMALASAPPTAPDEKRPASQSELPVLRFDIPAGPLAAALDAYETVARVRVDRRLPADGLAQLSSRGVSGLYTARQALTQVLAGTGVTLRYEADVAVVEIGMRESVSVTARRPISSLKYAATARDIPQTVSVIPREMIAEQGATTLRDVLSNVTGLTMLAGEGGNPAGDNIVLRGFSARNDVFVDGVRDLGAQSRDPFNLEQVEVTKGPASVLSGRGSTGGSINLVSKSPAPARLYGGGLALGTDETMRGTLDLNQPISGLGQGTSLRLTAMAHQDTIAGRDTVENERWGLAPSLAFGLGSRTRLTLSYFHLQADNLSDYGIPWVPVTNNVLVEDRDGPAPVPRETFYGFRSRDHEDTRSDLGTARFEQDLGAWGTLRSQLRYGASSRDSMATPPRFASNDSTVINREMRSWITDDGILDNQTDFQARFKTGGVDHVLTTGVALSRETNERVTRTAPNSPTTLLNPNPDDVYTGTITISPIVGDVTGKSVAVYALDTVSIGPHFELAGGLRFDRFDAEGVTTTDTPLDRVDEMLSYRVGVIYKPVPAASLYAAAGNSFNPSLEGLSYNTVAATVDPEKTYNYEVGAKWDALREKLSLAAAVFRIDKTNARTPGVVPGDPPIVLDGRQRVDGVELSANGSLTRNWRLFLAYTFLDGTVVESNNPVEVGHVLANTPRHSLSVWTTTRLAKLDLGGGARYTGTRYASTTNNRNVGGYWVLDAMAGYPVSGSLSLRLNLSNLTDEYYFDRLAGGHLVPGAGRRALLSADVRF